MAASSKISKGAGSRQARAGTTSSGQHRAKATGSKQQTGKATDSKQAAKSAGSTTKATRSVRAKSAGSTAKASRSTQAKATKPKRETAKATGAKRQAAKAASPRRQAAKTAGSKRQPANGAGSKQQTGIYVYGILPADVELTADMPGVGDPPGQVQVVRSDGLAALVSEVDVSSALGSPQDLTAHQQIVDATAAVVPVLPARFGAVMASKDDVVEDLLTANHDEFDDSLKELEGRAQYVVKGRYVENAILEEILSENRQAARLGEKLRGANPDATRDVRIKLGEIINEAVAAKRRKDTNLLGHAMEEHSVASMVREPTHELDAAHVAFLVETDRESEVEQVIEDLAGDWEGRIELRLLGPMAAYDFVGTVLSEA